MRYNLLFLFLLVLLIFFVLMLLQHAEHKFTFVAHASCPASNYKIEIEDLPNDWFIIENYDLNYYEDLTSIFNASCKVEGFVGRFSGNSSIDICYYSVLIFETDKKAEIEMEKTPFKDKIFKYSKKYVKVESFGNAVIFVVAEKYEDLEFLTKILLKKLNQ